MEGPVLGLSDTLASQNGVGVRLESFTHVDKQMDKKGKGGKGKGKGNKDASSLDQEAEQRKILKGMNTSQLKIKINELKVRINQLIEQIHQESAKLKEEERQLLKTNYEMEIEIQAGAERKSRLEEELEQQRQAQRAELERFQESYSRSMEELEQRLHNEMQVPRMKQKELEDNIRVIKEFVKEEYNLRSKKEALQRKIAENKEKQEQDLKKLFKKNEAEKKKIQDNNLQEYKKIKADQLREAQTRLGLHQSKTKLENNALEEQIALYTREKDILQAEILALRDEVQSRQEQRKKDDDGRSAYILETHKANSKIKRLKEKERQFQVHIKETADKMALQLQEAKEQSARRLQGLAKQIKSADQLLRQKNKELSSLKGLCQLVLDHRSDVEQYFVEVLMQESPKLDMKMSEITEDERDRLLRLLFTKINSGAPPINWREYSELQ